MSGHDISRISVAFIPIQILKTYGFLLYFTRSVDVMTFFRIVTGWRRMVPDKVDVKHQNVSVLLIFS